MGTSRKTNHTSDQKGAMDAVAEGLGSISLGRFAEAEGVAALVLFLASDKAGIVTGSEHVIDGGLINTT